MRKNLFLYDLKAANNYAILFTVNNKQEMQNMYTIQPKKLLIINILDILKKYTDVNHRLSQKEIVEMLQKEYSMKADRKAVKRNLMNLIDFGYPISYSESVRIGKNG